MSKTEWRRFLLLHSNYHNALIFYTPLRMRPALTFTQYLCFMIIAYLAYVSAPVFVLSRDRCIYNSRIIIVTAGTRSVLWHSRQVRAVYCVCSISYKRKGFSVAHMLIAGAFEIMPGRPCFKFMKQVLTSSSMLVTAILVSVVQL